MMGRGGRISFSKRLLCEKRMAEKIGGVKEKRRKGGGGPCGFHISEETLPDVCH